MPAVISTGEPATLATYRKISALFTGKDSRATKLLDELIAEEGEDSEVVQDESQMMYLIVNLGLLHGTACEEDL